MLLIFFMSALRNFWIFLECVQKKLNLIWKILNIFCLGIKLWSWQKNVDFFFMSAFRKIWIFLSAFRKKYAKIIKRKFLNFIVYFTSLENYKRTLMWLLIGFNSLKKYFNFYMLKNLQNKVWQKCEQQKYSQVWKKPLSLCKD
jgi:hypothetical protein